MTSLSPFLALATIALAGDPDVAHPHPATLTPITSAPAATSLSAAEIAELEEGEPVLRQSQGDSGGAGTAIQYIEAPADVVWSTILNYAMYDDWVKNVVYADVYKSQGDDLWVDIQSSIMGVKTNIYTVNTVKKNQGYMSWVLDRERTSDVQDMIGYWRVEEIRADPPLTRLDYSTQMTISGVPGFVVRYLTQDSLVDGTAWVKERSEAAVR